MPIPADGGMATAEGRMIRWRRRGRRHNKKLASKVKCIKTGLMVVLALGLVAVEAQGKHICPIIPPVTSVVSGSRSRMIRGSVGTFGHGTFKLAR